MFDGELRTTWPGLPGLHRRSNSRRISENYHWNRKVSLPKLSRSAKGLVNHTQIVLKNPPRLLSIACDRPIQ